MRRFAPLSSYSYFSKSANTRPRRVSPSCQEYATWYTSRSENNDDDDDAERDVSRFRSRKIQKLKQFPATKPLGVPGLTALSPVVSWHGELGRTRAIVCSTRRTKTRGKEKELPTATHPRPPPTRELFSSVALYVYRAYTCTHRAPQASRRYSTPAEPALISPSAQYLFNGPEETRRGLAVKPSTSRFDDEILDEDSEQDTRETDVKILARVSVTRHNAAVSSGIGSFRVSEGSM